MKRFASNHWFWAGAGFGLMVAMAGLVGLHSARADGVPADPTMYYAGVLEAGGVPVDGSKTIVVSLFDAAVGGTQACTVSATVEVSSGHFRVPLPAECTTAVQANPDLFAEVSVEGNTLARTSLGAVPYAVEAKRASAAAGPLASDLNGLTSDITSANTKITGLTSDVNGLTSDVSSANTKITGLTSDVNDVSSDLTNHINDTSIHHPKLQCSITDKVCGTGLNECHAVCPSGSFVTGGGCDANSGGLLEESYPEGIGIPDGWNCQARDNGTGSSSVNAWVVCCHY